MYIEGEKYLFRELGTAMVVTLINQDYNGESEWHGFELQVEKVLSSGLVNPESMPELGSTMIVGYEDGYRHYAGWSLEDLPWDPEPTEDINPPHTPGDPLYRS